MHKLVCTLITLTGLNAATLAHSQFLHPVPSRSGLDIAVTYGSDRARLAPGKCGCFWLRGGTADVALTLRRGFSVAASIAGDERVNYAPGLDFNKVAYLTGPRYGWTTRRGSADRPAAGHLQFFGEALVGVVHAFHGTFPSGTGLTTSATSFALQTGGGVTLALSNHFGLRLAQAEYVRTQLPNGFANTQNDLRLSAGISFRLASVKGR